ncbi:Transcription factor [Pseudoloma neurophilia]|uniref:Transcription factor n=1 Tax=Pseudoloma neurophilia TaxID=146866 RepID=A0A0R0M4X0_9MICR|nr:Transcription factor [Pseudoloma neurophilia]
MEVRKSEIDAAIGLLKISSLKKKRIGFGVKVKKTNLQQSVLKSVYEITNFPSTETRNELALLLGISQRSVQVWFQNKRQISKKKDANRNGGTEKPFVNEYTKFLKSDALYDPNDEFVCDISSTKLFDIIKYCIRNDELSNSNYSTLSLESSISTNQTDEDKQ